MNSSVIYWLISISIAINCFFTESLQQSNEAKRRGDSNVHQPLIACTAELYAEPIEINGLVLSGLSQMQQKMLLESPKASDDKEESDDLTPDQKIFIATIYAEATVSANGYYVSPIARQAIACVIMNRVGQREWASYQTAGDVCAYSGFSAHGSYNYQECMKYLDNRDGSNQLIEELISQVMPIYTGELPDITGGAQLFYTPAAMKPHTELRWNFNLLEEVIISGVDPYFEGRFYRYKG